MTPATKARPEPRVSAPAADEPPAPTPADLARARVVRHFCRLQLPAVRIEEADFLAHLTRTFALYHPKAPGATWAAYLEGLYATDWAVCVGCLTGQRAAWDVLFAARTGRSDCLLVDALRARAVRLYPRDDERQDTAVTEFWSNLIAGDGPDARPILARYDGQRPLAPWLIRVFQNWHLSQLRRQSGVVSLPDDEIALPLDSPRDPAAARWHEAFVLAARDWLEGTSDDERLLLGLRWRYRMSQRDAAGLLGLHEGSISRRTDKLRDRALEQIGGRLVADGWTGDDLEGFVLTELGAVLTDDPRLSADHLARLLAAKGKALPA
jgi:RNA polymerase sigma factor (sigma-70 family)